MLTPNQVIKGARIWLSSGNWCKGRVGDYNGIPVEPKYVRSKATKCCVIGSLYKVTRDDGDIFEPLVILDLKCRELYSLKLEDYNDHQDTTLQDVLKLMAICE